MSSLSQHHEQKNRPCVHPNCGIAVAVCHLHRKIAYDRETPIGCDHNSVVDFLADSAL